MDLRDEAGRVTYMESISRSLEQHYTKHMMMYYNPFPEIGRSQSSYTLSRRGGSEGKGSWKGLFIRAECRLQHKRAWAKKKGWHKGIGRDVRGKNGSDPEACRELVDLQLSIAGKGRHLRELRSQTGVISLSKTVALLCCERAAECAEERKTDLMMRDKQVVNNRGDRLWGLELERELGDRPDCSQHVKHMRGWHDVGSWIACEGDADDPSFSISLEDRFSTQEGEHL
jgi:hypothetical protein